MPAPPSTVASASDPLGCDMKIGADLDPSGRSASGFELVLDAMLHRLQENTLLLTGAPDDQIEFGIDVRQWIGGALSQDDLNARAPQVEEVLRRDPRIASIAIAITVTTASDASQYSFLIAIKATTINGIAIDRIVGVSQVSVEFLAAGR